MTKSFIWKARKGKDAEDCFYQDVTNWLRRYFKSEHTFAVSQRVLKKSRCGSCGVTHEYYATEGKVVPVEEVWRYVPIPSYPEKVKITVDKLGWLSFQIV